MKCQICFDRNRNNLVEVDLCYSCAIDIGYLKEEEE